VKRSLIVTAVVLLLNPGAVVPHRLDEYLQATIFSIDADHIQGSMRLVPGVAVASAIISGIDTDHDGLFSDAEQQAYAQGVLRDLALSADGTQLKLNLVSVEFPAIEQIEQGIGDIHINFSADLPAHAANRHLVFENRHRPAISVYLVNSLVPSDKNIQITAQSRNENQSSYQLDFVQTETTAAPQLAPQRTLLPSFSGFAAAFRLGIHHIAEGADHLLFLLALLLPAPLTASASVWNRCVTVRASLLHILGIVTAFTLGHSLTLALSVFGLVTLPSRPVEVLIAVSILVSAIHALRPLFPGREAAIAAFFGLIHGLAFASALTSLGFDGWYRLVSLLVFNLGIETMQLAVVAAILPSLLLLRRTRAYSALRIAGAVFAVIASTAWIAERLLGMHTPIDRTVESVATHGLQLALALFLLSVFIWLAKNYSFRPPRMVRETEV
jgi:HupE/UreJ protein